MPWWPDAQARNRPEQAAGPGELKPEARPVPGPVRPVTTLRSVAAKRPSPAAGEAARMAASGRKRGRRAERLRRGGLTSVSLQADGRAIQACDRRACSATNVGRRLTGGQRRGGWAGGKRITSLRYTTSTNILYIWLCIVLIVVVVVIYDDLSVRLLKLLRSSPTIVFVRICVVRCRCVDCVVDRRC